MRKRSNTIYAQNIEEFNILATRPRAPPALQLHKRAKTFNILPESTPEHQAKDSAWDDFDFGCDLATSPTLRTRFKRQGSSLASLDTDTGENVDLLHKSDKTLVKKIMVIGQRGSGKHFIVNSVFQNDENQDSLSVCQTMDFLLKTEADGSLETKYHFWIRELNEHKFDALIKVYYKIISVFVFVYSTTDRESFEALEEAIESVVKEVGQEKFFGVLLANADDCRPDRKCEVSHAEGVALKEKYNLAYFIDSKEEEMSFRQNLLQVLNSQNEANI